jgi:hypothetical protein
MSGFFKVLLVSKIKKFNQYIDLNESRKTIFLLYNSCSVMGASKNGYCFHSVKLIFDPAIGWNVAAFVNQNYPAF